MTERELRRFLAKVSFDPDGCWRWTACTDPFGYGKFARQDSQHIWAAHRVSYEHFYGQRPPFVGHRCGNRSCVNPDHLRGQSKRLQRRRDPYNTFWRNVRVPTNPFGCWLWHGVIEKSGYGKIGGRIWAHRLSYSLFRGEVGGADVLHNCDNPPCVNPSHLRLGTPSDNMTDAYKRGRRSNTKLTPCAVRLIRDRLKTMRPVEIATEFDISPDTVHRIRRGRSWAWVNEEVA